jgi:hypothetical protein
MNECNTTQLVFMQIFKIQVHGEEDINKYVLVE